MFMTPLKSPIYYIVHLQLIYQSHKIFGRHCCISAITNKRTIPPRTVRQCHYWLIYKLFFYIKQQVDYTAGYICINVFGPVTLLCLLSIVSNLFIIIYKTYLPTPLRFFPSRTAVTVAFYTQIYVADFRFTGFNINNAAVQSLKISYYPCIFIIW